MKAERLIDRRKRTQGLDTGDSTMAKKRVTTEEEAPVTQAEEETGDNGDAVSEGYLLDYITGQKVKENGKELVRQRIARALFHEYHIPPQYMERDFKFRAGENNASFKVDIAIFGSARQDGTPRAVSDLRRVVFCKEEPKAKGKNKVTKLRDYEAAEKDLEGLKAVMEAVPSCRWGLWTNGLDFFFLHREEARFEVRFKPVGDWPPGDETPGSRDVVSNARMRRADPDMLRVAFRRCHNFIHGNGGIAPDKAFWQFLYLIFCKMHDERNGSSSRRFWAGPSEQFDPKGQQAIRERVLPLFDEVKKQYAPLGVFRQNDEITLNDKALAFMVSELARYDFTNTDLDAKGAAYQEIAGDTVKGDLGKYFTPRRAIKLMVQMLDPRPEHRVIDPACGTGGFLVAVLAHVLDQMRQEAGVTYGDLQSQKFKKVFERFREFTQRRLFGADFDPDLVKTTQMNVLMASNETGNIFHIDSLEFPGGSLDGVPKAKEKIKLGSIDLLFTNPPFGADIPITDPQVLRRYDLAHVWERRPDNTFANTGRVQGSVAPEILFIEQCLNWLKPGGRMAIVLPDGILGNPGDEPIRAWILKNAWVLASVDLPVEPFIVEANVNILTSLLFLKKKTEQEKLAEGRDGPKDYLVFMAVAEKTGVDRRGNTLYKRHPDGEIMMQEQEEQERIGTHTATLHRKRPVIADDLPEIGKAYLAFREQNREPGA